MAVDFELSFFGKPFRIVSPELAAEIDRLYPLENGREFVTPPVALGPGGGLNEWLQPILVPDPPPKLYQLYWPTGASRWGMFRGLMHKDDFDSGTGQQIFPPFIGAPSDLVMDDGHGSKITARMQLLSARPIFGVDGASDLYLVTLVDRRYKWQWMDGGPDVGSWGTELTAISWDSYINQLQTFLQTTITWTTPTEEYRKPAIDSPLSSVYVNRALLADAVADTLGCFWCHKFDGTDELVRHADATTNAKNARQPNRKRAGGIVYDGSIGATEGGKQNGMPAVVHVAFPWWVPVRSLDGEGEYHNRYRHPTPPYDEANWLKEDRRHDATTNVWPNRFYTKGVQWDNLGPPYSDIQPQSYTVTIYPTMKAELGPTDPTNKATLDATAERLGKDVMDRLMFCLDEVYNGVVAFDPKGGCDLLVDWLPRPMTRVRRRPPNQYHKHVWLGDGNHRHAVIQDAGFLAAGKVNDGKQHFQGIPKQFEVVSFYNRLLTGVDPTDYILDNPPSWVTGPISMPNQGQSGLQNFGCYYGGGPGFTPDTANGTNATGVMASTFHAWNWFSCNSGGTARKGQSGTFFGLQFTGGIFTGQTGSSVLTVPQGGTGQSTLVSNRLLAGAGTDPMDSVMNGRTRGEDVDLKAASDSWYGITEASF